MHSFTEDIKNEITLQSVDNENSRTAMLSGFIRTCGNILLRNGSFGFEIVTENEGTAVFFADILENYYGISLSFSVATTDLTGRNKFIFECFDPDSDNLLKRLRIIKEDRNGKSLPVSFIDDTLFIDEDSKAAYLKGAFLGGGSCTLPEEGIYSRTGYHFEIVFNDKSVATDFCGILCDFDILAKLVMRKDATVVYIKSKEVISDVLNAMDCYECLNKLNKLVEFKDRQNNANRVNNCSVSNIDKTVTASVKMVRAIEIISRTIGLQSLEKTLFDVAEGRLADKNASMQELADRLHISKSCINHRMRKILDIAQSLNQD